MKKKEALAYIAMSKGHVHYAELFEIYNDEDEIPQELIDISVKQDLPRAEFMVCSSELAKELKAIFEYFEKRKT